MLQFFASITTGWTCVCVCYYLTVACVGQPFPGLLQVAQVWVNHSVSVAGQLGTVPVTHSGSSHTLVLRAGVAQTDAVPGDTSANTNVFTRGKLENVNNSCCLRTIKERNHQQEQQQKSLAERKRDICDRKSCTRFFSNSTTERTSQIPLTTHNPHYGFH